MHLSEGLEDDVADPNIQSPGELRERVVHINRVTKVVKGGKNFSFSALVVVGDGNGWVGYGTGKAREVPSAISKGVDQAKRNLMRVPLRNNTIPHPKSMSFTRESNDEWVHLVVPSSDVLARLSTKQAELGIELPLDPQTGEVFCATCHNPHSFKIGGEHGSQSKDVKHRLRMDNICQACHEK